MRVLQDLCSEYKLPGITAAFVFADNTSVTAAYGVADKEANRLMTPSSRMLVASTGKTMVAATVMSLWEEGLLDLDGSLSCYLGHFHWYSRLGNHKSLTLRQLLGHRSGLADHVRTRKFAIEVARGWEKPGVLFSPEELLGFILDKSAQGTPNLDFVYSDSGYILIGLVIETVTGESYFDTVRERFLTPLCLSDTSPANKRSLSDLAAGYTSAANAFMFPAKSITVNGEMAWNPGLEWTGGGLVSSSSDLASWGHALFSGKVLTSQSLELMLQAHPIDSTTPERSYGLGIEVNRSDSLGEVYGHAGWIPGYVSSLRYYSRYGITLALQINTDIGISGDNSHHLTTIESLLMDIAFAEKSKQETK